MSDREPGAPPVENTPDTDPAVKDTLLTKGAEGDMKSTDTPSADGAPPKLPHAWMTGLTSEQKADAALVEALSKFPKGIPDMAASYVELERKQSQVVGVPNEKASDEEKARYRKAIGVPDKPDDYKLDEVQLPKGMAVDAGMQKAFLEVAHKVALTPAQANAINGWFLPAFGKQLAAAQKLVKISEAEALAGIHERHGVAADAAETYMQRGFKQFAKPGLAAKLKHSGYGNDPDFIDLFIEIGKFSSEHPFVDGSRGQVIESGPIGSRSNEEIARTLYPEKREE